VTAQALFQCTQDHEEYLQAYVQRFLRLRTQAPTVPNKIVIEAMIKGLHLGPTVQYFARKPQQTLEKLLQKMDEYIRADNDFRQRREETYRYSKMTRGFRRRLHLRHVRMIHNPSQSEDRDNHNQGHQHSSQSTGTQQRSFRPPAPRGRGGRSFGGRFNSQPRRLFCLFYGEDKGHTTRTCQVTIQKQKEIAEAEARQNQPKQVLHTASCHSPYIIEYVGNQQPFTTNNFSSFDKPLPAAWALPQPPVMDPTLSHNQQPEGQRQIQQQRDAREESKLGQLTTLF
jgi:hypothetical protein